MTAQAGRRPARVSSRVSSRSSDQRGDYAIFIAVIATALLLFGGIAYDVPRLNAARQDALHKANEAARVAAATIASGGTVDDAWRAAGGRMAEDPLVYGEEVHIASVDCVGSRVQVTVVTGYVFRSAIAAARARQTIAAVGAAEASLVQPGGRASTLHYLGECPLSPPS